jgi:hypothetical protein
MMEAMAARLHTLPSRFPHWARLATTLLAACCTFLALASAQPGYGPPDANQNQPGYSGQGPGRRGGTLPPQLQRSDQGVPFQVHTGYPAYGSGLGAFPQAPGAGGQAQGQRSLGRGFGQLLPFPTTAQSGPGGIGLSPRGQWPSWLGMPNVPMAGRQTTGLAADRFLIVRYAETIEVRPGGEKAFYPLQFWSKVQEMGTDSAARSRGGGHLLMAFSDGTRMDHRGSCDLQVLEINEERLSMAWTTLDRLVVRGGTRTTRLQLPEQTIIEVVGAEIEVDAIDEFMLRVRNFGPGEVQLASERGDVTLQANERCHLPMVHNSHPRAPLMPAAEGERQRRLGSGYDSVSAGAAAEFRMEGRSLVVESTGRDAPVRWGGASFQIGAGARLTLDPLAGDSFPVADQLSKQPQRQ